jgi:hypothetical protein
MKVKEKLKKTHFFDFFIIDKVTPGYARLRQVTPGYA